MPVLADAAGDRLRATGYGIFNMAGCIAGGVVAALAGALKDVIGLAAAFQLAGAILAVSALFLLQIRRAPNS